MNKQLHHQSAKSASSPMRRERQRRNEELQRIRRKRLLTMVGTIVGLVVALSILVYLINLGNQTTQGQAVAATNPAYPSVDGVSCDQLEQTAYHIHAHVSIYINGQAVSVPAGIGIASDGSCYYWLHTHSTDGIIHIESPGQHTYTLGNFFDIWSERFAQLGYPTELSVTTGWQVYVNGKPYSGDFHQIPLQAHELITLAYNSPGVHPDTTYNWNGL